MVELQPKQLDINETYGFNEFFYFCRVKVTDIFTFCLSPLPNSPLVESCHYLHLELPAFSNSNHFSSNIHFQSFTIGHVESSRTTFRFPLRVQDRGIKEATPGFAHPEKFSLSKSFKFVVCNLCQSSPSFEHPCSFMEL